MAESPPRDATGLPGSPPGINALLPEMQTRMDRMVQAAKADKAKRGKATMLQRVERENSSVSTPTQSPTIRFSPTASPGFLSFVGRTGTSNSLLADSPLSPCGIREFDQAPSQSDGALKLLTRLAEMGISPSVEEGPQPKNESFVRTTHMSFNNIPFSPAFSMEGVSLHSIISRPPPPQGMVQCFIRRDLSDKRAPKFEMYLEQGSKFLLAARKRKLNTTSNYLISCDKQDLHRHSETFIGKLRSNFLGTEFMIYDNGEGPGSSASSSDAKPRRTLGCVLYEPNVLGTNGPRKMYVAIPKVTDDGKLIEWNPDEDKEGTFLDYVRSGQRLGLIVLRSVEPEWVPEKNKFMLNFNGRVKLSSVKNFQLRERDRVPVLVQFGKVDTDLYALDFQHPFTALQAFAVALSSFDSKLACD